jgi:hypothetical protein
MMQSEVESQQVEGVSCLSAVQFLCSHEVLQISVISPDFDFMLGAFDKVPPFLKCADDHQHFLVMDFIVVFHSIETFGQEGDWMPFVVFHGRL